MKKTRKMLLAMLMVGLLYLGCSMEVFGAEPAPYGFVQTDKGVMWGNGDGTWLKDSWLEIFGLKYYLSKEGYIQVGLTKIGDKTYYLYPEGKMATGWLQLQDGLYYFLENGTMAVNVTVGNYQIGSDGKAIGLPDLQTRVNSIIQAITTSDMTNDQKLLACYQYILNNASYKRTYDTPSGDWTGAYAMELLSTGQGNCYRYAAGFAYLAKELGYETRVITGTIRAARGGVTPHGWVEIKLGDNWYIFDPEMQDAKGYDLYMKTYENYPVKPLNKETEWSVQF